MRNHSASPILRHTLRHQRELFGRGLGLMLGFPLGIGHAVNQRATGLTIKPARFGQPVAKAVAAEAGMAHQIDILNVGAVAQVADQPSKSRCRYGIFNLHI